MPAVAAAAPVFMTAVYGDNGAQTVYVGVDTNTLALKSTWRIDGKFPEHDGEWLIGAEAARHHGWRIGDRVQPGQSGVISGILQPVHGAEDSFIYMCLTDAQRIFRHTNELTHILIRLNDPNRLDEAVAQLRGCDAGLSMNIVPLAHLFRSIRSIVNSTRVLLGSIALVALLAAGTGVSNTILMAVAERARDLGVMRALGASRANIFRLVWLETIQLCFVGSALGIAVAFVSSRAIEQWARAQLPFAPSDALVRWEWWIAAVCLGCALIVGSLAGLLPAWRAASIAPVISMRRQYGGA